MKSVKEYLEDVAFDTVYTLMAMPFVLGIGIPVYQAYHSGFVKNYNQAIVRNVDINKDGTITPTEELKIRTTLHNEIAELGREGRDLDYIVDWLKTR